jgi:adenine-specific DNA-methyltransferase
MDWSNRLILGDSLQVMASLAQREDLAGKVQMIYIDPPYGIRFGSNFQPTTQRSEIKDRDADLTREPEMIRAYRDTWHLGVHSYLTYLRDRLVLCRQLLRDSGALFVQIGEDNLHRVRGLIDEVFGTDNVITTILVKKKGGQKGSLLEGVNDYIIFAVKDLESFVLTIESSRSRSQLMTT